MEHISTIVTFCRVVLAFLAILDSVQCKESTREHFKGHLQPIFTFGDRQTIIAVKGFPTPLNFFREFVSQGKPVLLQNAAKSFPACEKWSDAYFVSHPESKKFQVNVETKKKENRTQPTDEVPFSTFLNHYHKKDIYMVDSIPQYLRKDVPIPSCLKCQDIIKRNMISVMMWMSNGGTKSVLHNDHAENINCVFKGTKTFFLVDRKYMDIVNVTELGYSDVDVESVDFDKYPGLYNIEHYKVSMQAGDCLYIPFLWVHQVTSHDNNIAVNFWWKDNVEVNPDHCDPTTPLTVGDVNFVGFDTLYEAQYQMIRGRFHRRIRQKGPMTFEDLVGVIRSEVAEVDEIGLDPKMDQKIRQDLKKIFRLLDSFPTDGIITKEDVDHVTKDDLETIRKYIASIVKLQQQTIEQMETLNKVKSDESEHMPDWTQDEIPPAEMDWKENSPQPERHSNQPPQEAVRWNDRNIDLMGEEMRTSTKKLDNNGDNNVTSLEMQWREMVIQRKLSLERREEL